MFEASFFNQKSREPKDCSGVWAFARRQRRARPDNRALHGFAFARDLLLNFDLFCAFQTHATADDACPVERPKVHMTPLHHLPIAPLFFALLVGAFLALFMFVQLGILQYAYTRLGVRWGHALLLLLASLFGSYVNIPIAQLPERDVVADRVVDFFGMPYLVPVESDWPGTIVAVNVGGAVIPTLLSLYLLSKYALWGRGLIAIAVVAAICHQLATPVPGIGIALPIFTPPIAAAITAWIVARRQAAPLAYVSGSMGALIGADLLNLSQIQGLGAPVASIGGAGTFDGIFVAGILAVLIASLPVRRDA